MQPFPTPFCTQENQDTQGVHVVTPSKVSATNTVPSLLPMPTVGVVTPLAVENSLPCTSTELNDNTTTDSNHLQFTFEQIIRMENNRSAALSKLKAKQRSFYMPEGYQFQSRQKLGNHLEFEDGEELNNG